MWKLLVGTLVGGLAQAAASLTGRVLLALGVSFVTYTGFQAAIDGLHTSINGYMGGLPGEIAGFLGYLWVDKAIATLFSAYAACIAVKMAGSTTITRMVTKK
jgi:hypothetical protein